MAKTQLQDVIGKNHISNSDVQLFFILDTLDFVRIRKSYVLYFVAAKKATYTAFCSCAPYAFRFASTKTICTIPPPYLNPDFNYIIHN
jgi:hypothetical protein